jgi:hypothetical protein
MATFIDFISQMYILLFIIRHPSVSFKWVVNRSLPTISYLTSLDKYAIYCICFICFSCVWHSLVGSFWKKETAVIIDQWMLVAFAVFFVVINVWMVFWFILSYRKIYRLKAEERRFFEKLQLTSSTDQQEKLIASF